VLTSKWYGETNKLVAAMFSLARKCAPSIIFLDEIDSFLRERSKGDHEVSSMMKAEFMTYVIYCRLFSPVGTGFGMCAWDVDDKFADSGMA
jgi:hypothetical protein